MTRTQDDKHFTGGAVSPAYRFSSSQRDTICSPPGVKARSFSAITPRSETVAFSNFRAKMEIFFRRCRRRRSSLLRSLQLTYMAP